MSVLLQEELEITLQSWKDKQQEFVAKLSILRKDKKYPKEIQNYVAQYQQDADNQRMAKWLEVAVVALGYPLGPRFHETCQTSSCFPFLELQ